MMALPRHHRYLDPGPALGIALYVCFARSSNGHAGPFETPPAGPGATGESTKYSHPFVIGLTRHESGITPLSLWEHGVLPGSRGPRFSAVFVDDADTFKWRDSGANWTPSGPHSSTTVGRPTDPFYSHAADSALRWRSGVIGAVR